MVVLLRRGRRKLDEEEVDGGSSPSMTMYNMAFLEGRIADRALILTGTGWAEQNVRAENDRDPRTSFPVWRTTF